MDSVPLPSAAFFPMVVVCSQPSARQSGQWKVQAPEGCNVVNPDLVVCMKMRWTRD